ncbi:RT0821/Lpp0805 family surface protein [Roseibium sp. HPY-6]|uniref:RT0821/Lpp0805 family surface protein n=1 Tax=Roseibium sp. HPY-6 TaxID=3229852 RepID=UPI00338F9AC5
MRSYTVRRNKIQSLVGLLLLLGCCLAGCARVTVPIGSNNVETPTVLTGSIPSPTDQAYADVDADDRAVIAENLDTFAPSANETAADQEVLLSWLNPISGNSGTLTKIDVDNLGETGCLSFETTANTIAGIRLYSGTACRDITQKFAVTALSVADA